MSITPYIHLNKLSVHLFIYLFFLFFFFYICLCQTCIFICLYVYVFILCLCLFVDLQVSLRRTFPSPVTIQQYGFNSSACGTDWSERNARVACREGGYTFGMAFRTAHNVNAWPARSSRFSCYGNETELNSCPKHKLFSVTCPPAGVYCFDTPSTCDLLVQCV